MISYTILELLELSKLNIAWTYPIEWVKICERFPNLVRNKVGTTGGGAMHHHPLARSVSVDNNSNTSNSKAHPHHNRTTTNTTATRNNHAKNLYRHKSFDLAVSEFKRHNDLLNLAKPTLDDVICLDDEPNNNDETLPSRLAKTVTFSD